MTLADIREYVFEKYGHEPVLKTQEWQQNYLYYPIKDGEVCLGISHRIGQSDRIFFNAEGKDWGSFCGCDDFEELDRQLIKYLPKKNVQVSLF